MLCKDYDKVFSFIEPFSFLTVKKNFEMSSEDEQHKSSLAAHYFATQEYQNKSSAGVRPIFDDFYPKCSNLQLNFNNPFILLFQTCAWANSSHHAAKQRRRRAYAIAHRHPLRSLRMLVRMRAMLNRGALQR